MRCLCAVNASNGEGKGSDGLEEGDVRRVRWIYVKGREWSAGVLGEGFLDGMFCGGY